MRRLKLQNQQQQLQQHGNNHSYHGTGWSHNVQHIEGSSSTSRSSHRGGGSGGGGSGKHRLRDPLGLAEGGKIGLPHSSSECSSNSSVEASMESNAGLVNGERKGNMFYFETLSEPIP